MHAKTIICLFDEKISVARMTYAIIARSGEHYAAHLRTIAPARSTGPAMFVGGWALMQLWLFWIAPIAGAALAGVVHRQVFSVPDAK